MSSRSVAPRIPRVAFGGRFAHHDASMAPVMFIHGPNTAGGMAASGLLSTLIARPEAMPAFCRPTSMATVRDSTSVSRSTRAPQ